MHKALAGLLVLFCFFTSASQKKDSNYVFISPSDDEAAIIRKAAMVRPSPQQLRWQQLELTAFFHFGINTFTGREWGDGKEDPQLFNPSSLNAAQWVRTAKEAGIRQVILTAKHHDGFCLWPTKTTSHSVKSSPSRNGKGDVVAEVARACRKYGLGFGVYLSPWDHNAISYGTEAYNSFFLQQLRELLTQYGKIDEVWFDGANGEGPNGKRQEYQFQRWYEEIRTLQPNAVIAVMGPDVRWVGTESGEGREEEWSVVPANHLDPADIAAHSQQALTFKPVGNMMDSVLGNRKKILDAKALIWYPAETDVSIRPGWFYHSEEDQSVKTAQQLFDIYLHSVGRNGLLLLNIPPDKRGLIHDSDILHLRQWRNFVTKTFEHNLAGDAEIQTNNGFNPGAVIDKDIKTYWTTEGSDTVSVLDIRLGGPKTFDLLMLQEYITLGQHIESFDLEYSDGKEWKPLMIGSTVGYKRILQFKPVTTDRVRLRILSSRLNPAISELGLYKIAW